MTRKILLALVCLLTFAIAATAKSTYLYLAVGGDNLIKVYEVDADSGELTKVQDAKAEGGPGPLAVSPDQTKLYAGLRTSKSVATYSIDSATGKLERLSAIPVAGNPVYLATDRTGKHLLTCYYGGDNAAFYPIDGEGIPQPEATQEFDTKHHPHSLMTTADNKFLYIPNTGSDVILQYRWNAAAGTVAPAATPQVTLREKDGPRHFTFHPSGNWVYFVNELSSSVAICKMDPETGALTPVQYISTLPEDFSEWNTCADIHITPDGRFVYASNRGHNSLAAYEVDPNNGSLTLIDWFPTEDVPREFCLSPDGELAYSAGQRSGKLAAYRINQRTGALDRFATYEVGEGPAWVLLLDFPQAAEK